jgi:large repetitive protein
MASAAPSVKADSELIQASPMHQARTGQTATLLKNGTVLVTGGYSTDTSITNTAEIYNPATGTWRYTASPMNAARTAHTATLLRNGSVLIAGGGDTSGSLNSAEIYDPATETFTLTGSMSMSREGQQAALLKSGKVIVIGGRSSAAPCCLAIASVEIYNPSTATWSTVAPYPVVVVDHQAVALSNGAVVVTGGYDGYTSLTYAYVYSYNPATNVWIALEPMTVPRQAHTATLLPSGSILIAAGGPSEGSPYNTTEIYNPLAGGSTQPGPPLNTARDDGQAALLADSRILVTGGENLCYGCTGSTLTSVEILDAGLAGPWIEVGPMSSGRAQHTETLLASGQVLIAGGSNGENPVNSADLWSGTTSADGNIIVTTNLASATFTLTGPATYNGAGTSASFSVPSGTYTITFGEADGYLRPPPQTQTVVGGTIRFNGNYEP